MYSHLRILLLASVIWAATLPTAFGADILLEDTFEFFELGETWQEHGAGVPDQALGVIFANDSEVLQMMTSGSSDEFFGVETIAPISIAGLSDLKVDARLRPINMGVEGAVAAAEVAIIGSSGQIMRAFASNNAGPDPESANDWADHYEDSKGNVGTTGGWPHCDVACDAMRNLVLSVTTSGTTIQAFDDLDDPEIPTWEATFDGFTLADFGTSITIALRQQALEGGDSAMGFFDNILVTSSGSVSLPGDFDGDGTLAANDINQLVAASASGANDAAYDLNNDGLVNQADVSYWAKDLKQTWLGDSNLDGEFSSADLVAIFSAGKFELSEAAVWTEGDWNGDLRFSTSDLVTAFSDGGYENGPRAAVSSVPEPGSLTLFMVGMLVFVRRR